MTEIGYSDGSRVEEEIHALIAGAEKLGSDVSLGHEKYGSWPVRYHLCPQRANLLRHFDFSGLSVLELGSGMGGVSRFLAEKAESLTVIEGDERAVFRDGRTPSGSHQLARPCWQLSRRAFT